MPINKCIDCSQDFYVSDSEVSWKVRCPKCHSAINANKHKAPTTIEEKLTTAKRANKRLYEEISYLKKTIKALNEQLANAQLPISNSASSLNSPNKKTHTIFPWEDDNTNTDTETL